MIGLEKVGKVFSMRYVIWATLFNKGKRCPRMVATRCIGLTQGCIGLMQERG
jgi:hypothetical protein